MDTLILNFFHDAICRLIPGIVVIGLYWRHLVVRAHDTLKGSSVFLAVCILLVAWLIGATLDTVTFAPIVHIQPIAHALLPSFRQGETAAQQTKTAGDKTVVKENETDFEKFERVQHVRLQAEVVLFRVMMCISAFTIVRPPTAFSGGQRIRRWYGIIGTLIFLMCWWFERKLV